MAELEVEVMLEDHPHLFLVDVESILEAEQLKDKWIKCGICQHEGFVVRVGTPSRKERQGNKPVDPNQKSMFKE